MDQQTLDGLFDDVSDASGSGDAPIGGSEPEAKAEPAEAVGEATETEPGDTGEQQTATPAEPEEDDGVEPDPNDPAEQTEAQRIGLRKALREERKRRQEFERLAAELKGQVSVYSQNHQQPAQQPAEAAESAENLFYKDPTAYVRTEVDKATRAVRFSTSEAIQRSMHEDYDDVVSEFMDAARDDPTLVMKMEGESDPAGFAYRMGKQLSAIKGVGSLEELEAKIEARLQKKYEDKLREEKAQAAAAQASTSSAGARGVGATSPVAVGSVDDLDFNEVLKGYNNRF